MSTPNLYALVRDLAVAAGIPELLVPAVVHRAEVARSAVESMRAYRCGRARACPAVVILAGRVVARSVADHQLGILERRCT